MDEAETIGLFNDMSEKRNLRENAEFCMSEHKKAFENWTEGEIVKYWEKDGVICIQYESGNWWHYRNNKEVTKETGEPCLEWW